MNYGTVYYCFSLVNTRAAIPTSGNICGGTTLEKVDITSDMLSDMPY